MNKKNKILKGFLPFIIVFFASAIAINEALPKGKGKVIDSDSSATLDYNEQTHLVFMREEEKLARDVYIVLGTLYPDSTVFGNIDDSEQRHTNAVRDLLLKYGVEDPSTNDNVGVFTGEQFGWYFTEKFNELTALAQNSEFDAYMVGALIEELDMHDINLCPKVIVETEKKIRSEDDCGRQYTDNPDVDRLLSSLFEGSESHLRAYVENIEKITGEGTYEAQHLTQEQVDTILGR